jgi:hypothetical protein
MIQYYYRVGWSRFVFEKHQFESQPGHRLSSVRMFLKTFSVHPSTCQENIWTRSRSLPFKSFLIHRTSFYVSLVTDGDVEQISNLQIIQSVAYILFIFWVSSCDQVTSQFHEAATLLLLLLLVLLLLLLLLLLLPLLL